MRCPNCKSSAVSGSPACPSCGLTLERVTRHFGVVPSSIDGISDGAGILSPADRRRIRSAANELSIRFPQTYLSVVTADLPESASIGAFAFWVFNQSGIVREIDRGSNNYEILLTLAPSSGRCSLMIGYGLENFISESDLEAIISEAQQPFAGGKFVAGIELVVAGLKSRLTDVVGNLENTHGIAPIVHSKSAAQVVHAPEY